MSRAIPILACFACFAGAADAQTARNDDAPHTALVGLGTSVVIADGAVFVGRTEEFPNFAVPPGARGGVHVFRRAGLVWEESGVMTAVDVPAGSAFGHAIAVRGATALVGAPKLADTRGAVLVFERAGDEWRLTARLVPADAAPGDSVGFAVALGRDAALVGAPGHGPAGAVYVFRRSGDAWQEAEKLVPGDAVGGARYGSTIVVRDDRAAIAAPGPLDGSLTGGRPSYQPGAVYVYARRDGAWHAAGRLVSADTTVRALGAAIVLTPNELLASAPATGNRGVIVRFAPDAARGWREAGMIVPERLSNFAFFGTAMARAGDDLLVGAPLAGGRGAVLAFGRAPDGTWIEGGRVSAETHGPMPRFGAADAAEGELAVAGAPGDDFFEGVGFALRRTGPAAWEVSGRLVDTRPAPMIAAGEAVACVDGAAAGFECSEVDLLSHLSPSALGAGRGIWISDIWGWTDPESGREIAIVGRIDGTAFVDVSDPTSPVVLGDLPLTEGSTPNLWRDMKVYRNHAFIVADNAGRHGMQVFDLTQLRNVTAPPVRFEPTTVYYGIHSSHNIVINEATGFAYTVGNSAGGETCGGHMHMVDIRDPRNPQFAGCYGPQSSHTHDAQCVIYQGPDPEYQGREICFNAAASLLGIGDVTDKANPVTIATATWPALAYSHQGWLSDDQRYFYLNDELDEVSGATDRTRTLIFDVTDLDDPILVNAYLGETGATDHNLYVRGRYLYESNYVAGLRILDLADPENPVEVGYFDTVPMSGNVPGFAGSWSNYPYFDSGIIVVTSIREGLFVLKKREPALVP